MSQELFYAKRKDTPMKSYHAKRIELHNHTLESDGKFTVPELADFFYENGVLSFSLTDHNTISGHAKMKNYLEQKNRNQNFIYGYELTSYYGHILCQNVHTYIPWDDIELNNVDFLLDRVHEAGGLVGLAHPCSISAPISNGLHFSMIIHDYSKLDFIEIVNNSHPIIPDNNNALIYWESLYLKGYRIAPVSGLDLHSPRELNGLFTTYLLLPNSILQETLENQLNYAIKQLHICVTRGPVIHSSIINDTLYIQLEQLSPNPATEYNLIIKGPDFSLSFLLMDSLSIPVNTITSEDTSRLILELYSGSICPENIYAVAPILK